MIGHSWIEVQIELQIEYNMIDHLTNKEMIRRRTKKLLKLLYFIYAKFHLAGIEETIRRRTK